MGLVPRSGAQRRVMAVGLRLTGSESPGTEEALVYRFDQPRVVFGRTEGADVRLPSVHVSHVHATLRIDGSGARLVDEGSTNGTCINGKRLPTRRAVPVYDNDEIAIADFVFAYETLPSGTATTSAEQTSSFARLLVRSLCAQRQGVALVPRLELLRHDEVEASWDLDRSAPQLRVGSDEGCDVPLPATLLQGHALILQFERDSVRYRLDVGASARPPDERLLAGEWTRLRNGRVLQVGRARLRFVDAEAQALDQLQRLPDQPAAPSIASGPRGGDGACAVRGPTQDLDAAGDADAAALVRSAAAESVELAEATGSASQAEARATAPVARQVADTAAANTGEAGVDATTRAVAVQANAPSRPSLFVLDTLVYGVSLLVIALSVLGIVLLLR